MKNENLRNESDEMNLMPFFPKLYMILTKIGCAEVDAADFIIA